MTRAEFNDAVDVYCQRFSASETSGRRSRARNTREKGVTNSAHLYGLGRDVQPDARVAPAVAVDFGRSLGLLVIVESDHHHLQPLTWRPG